MKALLRLALVGVAALSSIRLAAQERRLPLEDVLKEKAGHFRLSSAWISGGAFDLKQRDPAFASLPTVRAYSGSIGAAVNWTYLGERTSAWANYVGDYSLATQTSLRSLSQYAEGGVMRRFTPKFTFGFVARAQSLNLGNRLFQTPTASVPLQSAGFGGQTGLGTSADPISTGQAALPNTDVFGLALGTNQRIYTGGLAASYSFSSQTDFRLSASISQSDFPPAAGTALPYTRLRGGYAQGSFRHRVTQRTTVTYSFQGGQSRAQSETFNFASNSFGLSRAFSTTWYGYAAGGGGASTAFRAGATIPWLFQYTAQGGLGYTGGKQGMLLAFMHDAGDRLALGFQSTSQLNLFWNWRPPGSGWALSARAGGVLLRAQGTRDTKAGSFQVGLSRRIYGPIYALAEVSYVTNVQFAPQRLLQVGTNAGLLDSAAQKAARLSIVYRPAPERK